MGIQKGPDQTMAGAGTANESAIGSDISKQFGIPVLLHE
jgi:hypothetical protein